MKGLDAIITGLLLPQIPDFFPFFLIFVEIVCTSQLQQNKCFLKWIAYATLKE